MGILEGKLATDTESNLAGKGMFGCTVILLGIDSLIHSEWQDCFALIGQPGFQVKNDISMIFSFFMISSLLLLSLQTRAVHFEADSS